MGEKVHSGDTRVAVTVYADDEPRLLIQIYKAGMADYWIWDNDINTRLNLNVARARKLRDQLTEAIAAAERNHFNG